MSGVYRIPLLRLHNALVLERTVTLLEIVFSGGTLYSAVYPISTLRSEMSFLLAFYETGHRSSAVG